MTINKFFTPEDIEALDLRAFLIPSNFQMTEQIRIKEEHPLYLECLLLCHKSKNLYNSALYLVKQQYKENGSVLNYETLANQLKHTPDFLALPAKVSQQTLKTLGENLKSFKSLRNKYFKTLKELKELKILKSDDKISISPPSLPNFYPSNKFQDDGLCVVKYTNQSIYKQTLNKEGLIHLSKSQIKFKSQQIQTLKDFVRLNQVRIIPSSPHIEKCKYFTVEVVYTLPVETIEQKWSETGFKPDEFTIQEIETKSEKLEKLEESKKLKTEKPLFNISGTFSNFAGLDLNLNQLALFENVENQSYLFDLKKLKSINWLYNKNKADLDSQKDVLKNKENKTEEEKIKLKKIKNKIKKLSTKRNGKIKYYSHKLSKLMVEKLSELKVKNLIIGKNRNFKKAINLGGKNNQNFVFIPFNQIFTMLIYKAHLKGINVFFVEESYTSKTSFLDKEALYSKIDKQNQKPKSFEFIGKRMQRGLFKTKKNTLINADINGALNIARKVLGESIYHMVNLNSIRGSSPKRIYVGFS